MKAAIYRKYGSPDVLELAEIPKPVPKDNEILVTVQASTVNRTDFATVGGIPWFARLITGIFRPKRPVPGTEFAGTVEAAGNNTVSFKPGARVFGFSDSGSGSHAQYLSINEKYAAAIPKGVSFKQAAASSEGAHYAYSIIKNAKIQKGDRVLVNGATGAIGSAAVQLLKHFGVNVTAVCAAPHLELVKALGADTVIDYTKKDFTKTKDRYTHVIDAVGKSSFFKCRKILKKGGKYVSSDLGFMAQNMFLPLITLLIKPLLGMKKTVTPFPGKVSDTLALIKDLMERGKFKAVIDREFKLEQIVEAYMYAGSGKKTGNVVLTIRHGKG